MTKKDYVAFAEMFKSLDAGPYTCPDVLTVVRKTADLFSRDNPKFDRERFLLAAGCRPQDAKEL